MASKNISNCTFVLPAAETFCMLTNFGSSVSLLTLFVLFSGTLAFASAPPQPDAASIVEQSVEANKRDWQAGPEYDHLERDGFGSDTKTWAVLMIDGSPYRRLVKVDGEPLPAAQERDEQRKMEAAIAARRSESAQERSKRISDYEKGRTRDHIMLEQLTKAFDFKLLGERKLNSRDVYLLRATPRPGYNPPNTDSQVLPGMKGELWIDKQTFQWVKVTARVIHPVSIDGFLARVEPGTYFELQKIPVAEGIWLPKHFEMKSDSKILLFFSHKTSENQTFSDYRKADPNAPGKFPVSAGSQLGQASVGE